MVSARMFDPMKIQENSQQDDTREFRQKKIASSDQDLGSRKALEGEEKLIWYPAEVDVSIRPGWFYHPKEDAMVRSPQELLEIYDRSVGGNALLLLNVPPMPDGRLNDADVKALEGLGDLIRDRQKHNAALDARIQRGFAKDGTFYIKLDWEKPVSLSFLVLQEDIRYSQRVEAFRILDGETKEVLYTGTVIGYKKHILLPEKKLKRLVVEIRKSRREPHILNTECY